MKYLRKKIFLKRNKSKWCIVRLYFSKKEMREAYRDWGNRVSDSWSKISGAHCAYDLIKYPNGSEIVTGETGLIFLYYPSVGAGIVSHEIMHAVLSAWKRELTKETYPIVIETMEEEEDLLYNHTFAVRQFYKWYWKNEERIKKLSK